MFIIFGWPRRKSGVHTLSSFCPRCRRETVHKGYSEQTWFTLFFIPVVPLSGKSPHALCNICGQDVWDRGLAPRRTVQPVIDVGGPPPLPGSVPPPLPGSTAPAVELLPTAARAGRPTKRCPACAEDIMLEASACRFCGRTFSAEEMAAAAQAYNEQAQAIERTRAAQEQQQWVVHQAEHQQMQVAWQQQGELRRLERRPVRRLIGGIVLISIGAFMLLVGIGMLFTRPAPGNTLQQQRTAAVFCGVFFGLAPLAVAIALFRGASSASRALAALSCPRCQQRNPPGSRHCGQCGQELAAALPPAARAAVAGNSEG